MKKTLLSILAMLLVGVSGAWAEGATVGNTDNSSTWWTAFSDYYKVPEGKRAHVTFTNYSDKTENFHNWMLVTNVADTERGGEGYAEYFLLRVDNYGWGTNYDETTLKSAYNWDTFKNDMDGSSVDMYVYNNSGKIYVSANITTTAGTVYPYSFNSTATGANDFTFFMTTELGHLENLNVTIEDIPVDNNWKIDFSALGLTADDVATVSTEVSSGLGTVTIGTTALDTRFGVQTATEWKFYAKGYLQNINKGGRSLGVFGAKAGQLIVLNATAEATPTTNATLKLSYGNQHVYEVTADGDVVLNMPKNSPIYSIQVSDNLYTYSVKAKSGETELGTIAAGVAEKGTNATTFWSRYVKVGEQWYVSDETTYGATLDETTPEKTVNYSASGITQFFEVNDDMNYWRTWTGSVITGNAAYSNGNGVGVGSSSGGYAYISTKSAIPAGTYEIGIYGVARSNKADDVNVFTSTDGTNWTSAGSFTMAAATGLYTTNITLASDSYIRFENTAYSSNLNHYLDYVTFAPVYAYSVTANGNTIISGTAGAGKELYWSKYQKIGDKWYSVPSTSMTVSANESENSIELEATATDVVYFTEAENMSKSRSTELALTGADYSNGKTIRHFASTYWYGEAVSTEEGTYTLSMPCVNTYASATTLAIYYRDSEGNLTDTGKTFSVDGKYNDTFIVEPIEIPANCSLVLYNNNTFNSNVYIDYVTLKPYTGPSAINGVNANVNANAAAQGKYIKNGRIVIVKNGAEYNAAGQQMK